ncbi:Nudix hydrolase 22, chloroplastic [Capsicum annuum]|nr:Nudix hydrolase 22, chloroplastic [Capsicum annuum]
MLSSLRKLSILSSISSFKSPNSLRKFIITMDSSTTSSSKTSHRLFALSQQLRLYKPPPTPFDEDSDFEEQKLEESVGKVVSQVGFQESVTPVGVVQQTERFRPKRAAVLICLFEGDDGELRVVLTKRSSKLSTHSGEVALPGGKAEEGDASDADTATREAKEEIGLDPSLVNVVTCLEPFLSKLPTQNVNLSSASSLVARVRVSDAGADLEHLLRVIPVIGILSNKSEFIPTPNVSEVEAVFYVPLEMFLKDENRRSEEREWMGEKYLIHLFDYEMDNKKYLIWGLTAGILIRAASVVYQRPPAFLEQNPKFKLPKVVDKNTTMS